jgi:PmbA protein
MKKNSGDQMNIEEVPGVVVARALKLGADDVICTAARDNTKQIRFANSQVTASKSWSSNVAMIFVAKDRRIVFTAIRDFSVIDKTLADMMKMLKVMEKSGNYHGIAESSFRYRKATADKKIPKLLDELYNYVDAGIDSAMEAGAKRVAGVLYSSHGDVYQVSSGGATGSYKKASIEISVRAMSDSESSGHKVQTSTSLEDFKPGKIGEEAGMLAMESRKPKLGAEGEFDVIFSPMAFANILDRVGSSASAASVDMGLSFFKDKLGKKVASQQVTVLDNPTRPDAIGSPLFDDEGVPTMKTKIIEKGSMKNYLHNTSTAKQFKAKTTANAGLVFPTPWNICLEPGDWAREEMLSEIKNGIYITNVWYTRFQNHQTGDFSTIPRDATFKIEKGKIVEPIKDIRVSENMLTILQKTKAVGRDETQIHWWESLNPTFSPHVLVEKVRITRSTQ